MAEAVIYRDLKADHDKQRELLARLAEGSSRSAVRAASPSPRSSWRPTNQPTSSVSSGATIRPSDKNQMALRWLSIRSPSGSATQVKPPESVLGRI